MNAVPTARPLNDACSAPSDLGRRLRERFRSEIRCSMRRIGTFGPSCTAGHYLALWGSARQALRRIERFYLGDPYWDTVRGLLAEVDAEERPGIEPAG